MFGPCRQTVHRRFAQWSRDRLRAGSAVSSWHPPIRSRRGPRRRRPAKPHFDKGYDYDHLRRWLRQRGIRHRIARKGVETSQRLGRHRWVVERTESWLAGCRRLHRRYERKAERFLTFVGIAALIICFRRLAA
ncbi:hypothetical protein GCM10022384_48820 [Streptomyces marokkonensis]|uniref:Transposase DDE domain-containing protein n=1 Tax=Streptomyces marokkonensis TaxID=324855 RepID=A0ABP7RCL9_9ACTN